MKRFLIISLILSLAAMPANAQLFKKHEAPKTPKIVDTVPGAQRVLEVLNMIQASYVIPPNTDSLGDIAVRQILTSLDPHSVYIPAKDVKRTNEALQGNFEGVGISFSVVSDTIRVQEVIAGGPSEKVGIEKGDKFIRIDGDPATGDSANTAYVYRHLRGPKGTMVVAEMLRGRDTLTFHIQRDKIPIHSVEVFFMEDDSIGYIALQRFARTSVDEFRKALKSLQKEGMKSLILDLRGNSGGFLDIAFGLANEFISPGKLIVYQEGRVRSRQDFRSNKHGNFRKGNLVVLIDEGSASASEIVSGAVQDWDRGLIIGRRSYGKGLVQTMFTLSDGGQVRLTTARYYTPSGRCIQRPYDNGSDEYNKEISKRYKHGEMFTIDSIQLPDLLKYRTAGGRTVYGGGGIIPDIFIPMDTTPATKYYQECRRKGILNQFPQWWSDDHRRDARVATLDDYLKNYDALDIDSSFVRFAAEKGVVRDSVKETLSDSIIALGDSFLRLQVKALVADRLFGRGHYYRIMKEQDACYQQAVAALRRNEKPLPHK